MKRRSFWAAGLATGIAAALLACGFDGGATLSGAVEDASARGTNDGDVHADVSAVDGAVSDAYVFLDGSAADGPPGDAAPASPASCTDVPSAAGTDVTLYVAHDPGKPWPAYCGASGETYLRLPAGAANNFSTYPANQCASVANGSASSVKTTWTRVRIDPVTLVVTTNDYAGATSTGATHEVSGNGSIDYTYVKMPFATGRTCDGSASTVAKVDLTGTKLHIAPNQFISEGFNTNGSPSTNAQVTTLALSAFPGGMHPCRPAGTDYYQRNGGKCLQLEYGP